MTTEPPSSFPTQNTLTLLRLHQRNTAIPIPKTKYLPQTNNLHIQPNPWLITTSDLLNAKIIPFPPQQGAPTPETKTEQIRTNSKSKPGRTAHTTDCHPDRTTKSGIRSFHTYFDINTCSNRLPYDFLSEKEQIRKKNCPIMPNLTKVNLSTFEKKKSFAQIKKSVDSADTFYLDGKRNAQRWQSIIKLETQKN